MLEHRPIHHIQRNILHSLLGAESKRYKDIKPAGLESNLFMYHLNATIKEGLVEKIDIGYTLSAKGKRYVDIANLDTLTIRVQPKIIAIIIIENSYEQILILERLHQPFIGHKGFPSGKIHYGESMQDAASRELFEKTGLTTRLTHRGTFIMRFMLQGTIVNHIIGFVYSGTTDCDTFENKSNYFKCYWGTKRELLADNRLKGHPELLYLHEHTPKNQLFYAEHTFDSDF